MDRCGECGYVYDEHHGLHLAEDLASLGPRYGERLRAARGVDSAAILRRRPEPLVWSALEYACHVRDVLLVQRERLFLALVADCPSFVPILPEQRVILARYAAQDPARVADQLEVAATLVADAFATLDDAGWRRPCVYNFPTPARHTLAWLGAHTLHEGEHHLRDVDRVLAELDSKADDAAGEPS